MAALTVAMRARAGAGFISWREVACLLCLTAATVRAAQGFRCLAPASVRAHLCLSQQALRRIVLGCRSGLFVGAARRWGTVEAAAYADTERRANSGTDATAPVVTLRRLLAGIRRGFRLSGPDADGNWLVVGAPGTGKTALFLSFASQAIHRGDVVVVIDPKSSPAFEEGLASACALARRDFFRLLPGRPAASVRFDPLENWQRPSEVATRVTRVLRASDRPDPFVDFAWLAAYRIACALAWLGRRPTVALLKESLADAGERLLLQVLERAGVSAGNGLQCAISDYESRVHAAAAIPEVDGLLALVRHDRRHYSKMVLPLLPLLDMLTAGELERLLSPSEADLEDPRPLCDSAALVRQRGVLYVGLESLGDATVARAIAGLVLSDLAAAAGARYRDREPAARVHVFVDEAGEVLNAPFAQLLNKGREAGFSVCFAVQTLADLTVALGGAAAAAMLIGNANGLIAFRSQDMATRRYLSEKLGRTRRFHSDDAHALQEDPFARPGEFTRSATRRTAQDEIDLVPPDLLGRLPDLHCFVACAGGETWLARLPLIVGHDVPQEAAP